MSCTYAVAPSSAAVASTRSRECEEIATRAPSATSSAAIPRPIPFDAPVTSATLPSKPRSMAGMLSGRRRRGLAGKRDVRRRGG